MIKKIIAGLLVSSCVSCGHDHNSTQGNNYVVALMGQSNIGGKEPYEFDPNNEHIKVLSLDNQIVDAKEPLFSSVTGNITYQELPSRTGTGPGIFFALDLLNYLEENDSVILVPCARGGSSMAEQIYGGQTSSLNIYFERSLLSVCKERIRIALNYEKSVYAGAVYFQGETDAINASIQYKQGVEPDYGYWTNGLLNIMSELKSDFNSDNFLLVQIGNIVDNSEDKDFMHYTWNKMKEHQNQFSHNYNVPMVVTDDLAMYDNVHLSARAQMTLGVRIAESFREFL